MSKPTDSPDEKTVECHARRHMSARAFQAYDAMVATAKAGQAKRVREGKPAGDLIFSGRMTTLANKINCSTDVAREGLKELVAGEWLIPLQEQGEGGQRRNNWSGTWATYQYKVLEHFDFLQKHPDKCPEQFYGEDGKPNRTKPDERNKRISPLNILRRNLIRSLGEEFAAKESDFINKLSADDIRNILHGIPWGMLPPGERLRAVQVPDPVPETPDAATVSETPDTVHGAQVPPCREIPMRPVSGNPDTTVSETPDTTVSGNPVTRFVLSAGGIKPVLPSCLPSGGRQAGASTSTKTKTMDEEQAEAESAYLADKERNWKKFLAGAKKLDAYRAVYLSHEEEELMRKQVDRFGWEPVLDGLECWADERKPPIEERDYGRWKCWVDEGGDFLAEAVKRYNERRRRNEWNETTQKRRVAIKTINDANNNGRLFVKSEWSFGQSDTEKVNKSLLRGCTSPSLTDIDAHMPFLQDFLIRFELWNVLCNGAPVPDRFTLEGWDEWVTDNRNDIAEQKDQIKSGK